MLHSRFRRKLFYKIEPLLRNLFFAPIPNSYILPASVQEAKSPLLQSFSMLVALRATQADSVTTKTIFFISYSLNQI